MAMYLLFEAAHGYALFEVLQQDLIYCTHRIAAGTANGAHRAAKVATYQRRRGSLDSGVCGLLQVKQADELAQGSAGATALASDLARFSKAIALTGFVPFSTAAQVRGSVLSV
jgi:LPS sulfotransferase NodH